ITGSKVKTLILDKFNVSDIRDLRIKVMTPERMVIDDYYTMPIYTTGTFAKLFEAPQANAKLNTVDVGRRDLDIPADMDDYPLATTSKNMRFLVHVILPDVTGGLGKTIFTKEVYITDGALKITIDVKDEKIIIPTKKFFIGIEWMLTRINEVIQLNIGNKVEAVKKNHSQKLEETAKYTILYQPFLVLFPSGVGTVGWQSADNKSWFRRDFRSPHPSRLHPSYNVALSATIVY
ncbi:MAG TPA: hypothetical protein VNW51_03605, partial [Mucilaginibacter sp.]|nr:hypothetical protein [Mucilaginibacter sp.]